MALLACWISGVALAGERYATTPFMEPDRCAVAWVVRRHIDPDATFEFYKRDAFPEGVTLFDLPESTIKRDARRSALEVLLNRHQLSNPFLDKLVRLVHDVEINAWSSRRNAASMTFEQIMVDALTDQQDPKKALELCFGLLDTLRETEGDVEGWSQLWRDERGAIRLDVPAMYRLEQPGLDNLVRVSERIYSGAEPEGAQGFESLRRLGVEWIVSVDGALPDVDRAQGQGMRYVHLPMGYAGVPDEVARSLREVSRRADGKIYVHCHHGRHRGPVAASLLLHFDEQPPEPVLVDLLELAGTSPAYSGLWESVREFDPAELGDARPELQAQVQVASFTASMALLDRVWDRIKRGRRLGWEADPQHPDVTPAHEALMLWEALKEAKRVEERPRDESFETLLDTAIDQSARLREALDSGASEAADRAYGELGITCGRCHESYRNN